MKTSTHIRHMTDEELSALSLDELERFCQQQTNLVAFHERELKAAKVALLRIHRVQEKEQ